MIVLYGHLFDGFSFQFSFTDSAELWSIIRRIFAAASRTVEHPVEAVTYANGC